MKKQTAIAKSQNFEKGAKRKSIQSSLMSHQAWCYLNNKGEVLKGHDMCPNSKGTCQKRITFSPRQFQLEGAGFKKNITRIFQRHSESAG